MFDNAPPVIFPIIFGVLFAFCLFTVFTTGKNIDGLLHRFATIAAWFFGCMTVIFVLFLFINPF